MASVTFSDSYFVSYVGDVSANIRLSFDESYTASTNKSVVTLSQIEVQVSGNSVTYPSLPLYGVIKLAGTTVAAIDNTQGGKMASVTISGNGYCQADISNLTITPVTVEHNADGTKDVTVQLSGGYSSEGSTFFAAVYAQQLTSVFTNYVPFGVKTNASKAMSLNAHTRQWTVSYNANGGSGAPAAQTKIYGQALTLSGTKPSKASASAGSYTVTCNCNGNGSANTTATAARTTTYSFSKWNTAADGSGTSYNPGGSYTANAAVTLYARWTGSTSTAAVTLPSPTRSGYAFAGWYTASSGGTKVGAGNASYTPSADITLYAHWTAQASTIASCSSSVATTNSLALTVGRKSTAFYHKATFKIGSTTLATSSAFGTSLSYTVPRTWFNSYPNDTSKTVTISVQTYTNSACTTAVGSPATTTFTMTADAGMRPSVVTGWVTHASYNTGSAMQGKTGYVKGYSKSQVTFHTDRITMANNATIASYSIKCQNVTDTSSPFITPTLNSTSAEILCTVTDSRGRSASGKLRFNVQDYAKPKLSGISVFRCNANGTADDDGTYYSVKATATVSPIINPNNSQDQNSLTLTGALKAAGGSYMTPYSLTSGTASVRGAIGADTSYTVKITATDALNNSSVYYAEIPTRKWAMKFRPTGNGVAFGKNAEFNHVFEVAPDWTVKLGTPLPISSGGTGGANASEARVNLGVDDLISNTTFNNGYAYSTLGDAVAAVFNSMSDGTVKIGRFLLSSNYTFIAYRNSANYGHALVFGYGAGGTLALFIKTNGTITRYNITGTPV